MSGSIDFKVSTLTHAGELLLIGIAAGMVFFLVDKYLIIPAEQAVGLIAPAVVQQAA